MATSRLIGQFSQLQRGSRLLEKQDGSIKRGALSPNLPRWSVFGLKGIQGADQPRHGRIAAVVGRSSRTHESVGLAQSSAGVPQHPLY